MNQLALNKFRQLLEELKQSIEQRADKNQPALDTVELDQNRMGRLTRMDALQSQQMAQEAERRRLLKLKQIEGALIRISNDDFGYCFKCAEDIAVERLKFDPTITRCINCSEANTQE